MVVLGGFIGIIILTIGVTVFGTGLKPVTLALIGLPLGAAMHTYQDVQAYNYSQMHPMNDTVQIAEAVELYGVITDDSINNATETYYDTSSACPNTEWEWEWYQGTWRYTRITQNGVDVATLSANDTLNLNALRFRYDIEALNKHANGVFSAVELHNHCAFNFMYLAPDGESVEQIRTFEIDYIDRDSLCISEGPLVFEYRKK